MSDDLIATRPARRQDAAALVGLLSVLEAHLLTDDLGEATVDQLGKRLQREGLVAAGSGPAQVRLALANLNQRLRVTLGEQERPEPAAGRTWQYFGFTSQSAAGDFASVARGFGRVVTGPEVYDETRYSSPVSWQVAVESTELPLNPQYDNEVDQLVALVRRHQGQYGGWSG